MAEPDTIAIPLVDCHPSLLQRVIDACDASDLFLLRQVCRRFRRAVDGRVRRIQPVGNLTASLPAIFPSLVSLDLAQCDPQSVQAALVSVVTQLPRLRELRLWKTVRHDGDDTQAWDAALRQLTALRIAYTRAGRDDICSLLSHCRSLQRLQFFFCRELQWDTVQAAVAQLAGTLTELDLSYCALTAEMQPGALLALNTGKLLSLSLGQLQEVPSRIFLSELAAFTSLSALVLPRNHSNLQDEGLRQLNALTRLTRLNLSHSAATYAGLAQLTRLSAVRDLAIACVCKHVAHPVGLATALRGFPSLTSLDVSDCRPAALDVCSQQLAGLTQLLVNGGPWLSNQAVLCDLAQLQDLTLVKPAVGQEAHLSGLSAMTALTRLCLVEWPALGAADWLASLTRLQHLTLSGRCEPLSVPQALAQLPALRALDLTRVSPRSSQDDQPVLGQRELALLARLSLQQLRLPIKHASETELAGRLQPGLLVPIWKWHRRQYPWLGLLD